MERFVLLYSPVWIFVMVTVQLTGVFRHWTDWQHMVLGVGLCLPLWLAPLLRPSAGERGEPFLARYSTLFNIWIFTFSFLQVYFGSGLFFGALGMEYHFHTTWVVNRSPLFLYFVTVVYFSSYYVVSQPAVARVFAALANGAQGRGGSGIDRARLCHGLCRNRRNGQ